MRYMFKPTRLEISSLEPPWISKLLGGFALAFGQPSSAYRPWKTPFRVWTRHLFHESLHTLTASVSKQISESGDMSNKRKSPTRQYTVSKKPRLDNGSTHDSHENGSMTETKIPLPLINEKYQRPVFTHPSLAAQESRSGEMQSYDRLEFLGDAYIEIIATQLIFKRFQHLPVGRLSSIREILVKNETLAKFSRLYGFDKKVRTGPFDHNDKSPGWQKILGDVFEAYVAAIILSDSSSGYQTAERWLHELWQPKLKGLETEPGNFNHKEELAKRILFKDIKLAYVTERPPIIDKKKGIETFFIGIRVTGCGYTEKHLGSGTGLNKSVAGMKAAQNALNNHPLIDELISKKHKYVEEKQHAQQDQGLTIGD